MSLAGLTTALTTNKRFSLEVKPAKGAALVIERTTPAVIAGVMDLN